MIELETVSVFRGDTDRRGNPVKVPTGSVGVVFAWGGVSRSSAERRESAESNPEIYAPAGVDLRARDRIVRSNGQRFAVVGGPLWDQPGGFEVFGSAWVAFEVELVNG